MKNRSKLFISIFLALLFFNLQAYPEDNLLTIKQQLDRLQREVNDISKSVFTNTKIQSNNKDDSSSNETINFAAIDMRIYDLEKDIKNLTMNLEEIVFQLDEIQNKIINIEQVISDQLEKINNQETKEKIDTKQSQEEVVEATSENTLGKLQISSNNNVTETRAVNEDVNEEDTSIEESQKLLPEEQFQIAFGKIRKKQYKEAKSLFSEFINQNTDNQLSGSAHYWLGELLLLEKNNKEAALILAEGYQKYPHSIKAPDMLYKLSEALFEIGKNEEACKVLTKLSDDFSTHKIKNKSEKKKIENSCDILSQ